MSMGTRDIQDDEVVLQGVSYKYPAVQGSQNPAVQAVPRLDLRLPGGHLISFPCQDQSRGQMSSMGINTLFKLITGEILPCTGSVSHPGLRLVYIPVEPVLFDGSLMYNLRYGSKSSHPDQEVWKLCKALGMDADLIGNANFDVGTNGEHLRYSDRLCVCIARALLHDVDFLFIGSALDVLGQQRAQAVLECFRGYVRRRGVGNAADIPTHLRHKKTIVFSTKYEALQQEAELTIKYE